MSQKFCKQIKTFDLFEKPIQLMFKNSETHRTLLGAIISLLLVFFILIVFGYNLIEIFQRINPIVVDKIEYNQDPNITFQSHNFAFQIGMKSENSSLIFDESIYQVNAFLQTTTILLVDGYQTISSVQKQIPLTMCHLLNTSKIIDQDNNYYCIDWNQTFSLNLSGSSQSSVQTKLRFDISQCVNSTQSNITCSSQEQIDQALSNSISIIRVSSNLINFESFLNPYFNYIHEIYSEPLNTLTKLINLQIQPIITSTDQGMIIEDRFIQSSYKVEQVNEQIKQKNKNILEIELELNFLQNSCRISYTKIQVIFGYIGGLWNVLFLITRFFYSPLSKLSYKLAIVNQLFNFDGCPDITSLKKIQIKTQISSDFVQEIITYRDENRTINNPTRYTKHGSTFHPIRRNNSQSQQAPEIVERDTRLSNQLQLSIRAFFNKSSRKIKLSLIELLSQFKIMQNLYQSRTSENKKEQFEYSVQSFQKNIDIINIMQKLQELEKLKEILLNPSQLKLFEYIPKPLISIEPNSFNNKFIIGNQKNRYQKSIDAQSALRDILRNFDEPINQKLLSFMDIDTRQLLQLQQSHERLQSPDSVQNEFINRPKPDIKINVRLVSSSDLEEQIYQQQEEEILQVKSV